MGEESQRSAAGSKVGFFGAFSSAQPKFYLPHCDFVIIGEPEASAEQIATSGRLPSGIVNSPVIPEKELDRLPFPKWDIFPLKEFSYSPVIKAKPFITIQSSRGCVFLQPLLPIHCAARDKVAGPQRRERARRDQERRREIRREGHTVPRSIVHVQPQKDL